MSACESGAVAGLWTLGPSGSRHSSCCPWLASMACSLQDVEVQGKCWQSAWKSAAESHVLAAVQKAATEANSHGQRTKPQANILFKEHLQIPNAAENVFPGIGTEPPQGSLHSRNTLGGRLEMDSGKKHKG